MMEPSTSSAGAPEATSSSGFTLISQLAALAIVGSLCAIAVASYQDLIPRVRLAGAARQIVSDLMFARMQALRDGNRHRVVFLTPQRYQVLTEESEEAWMAVLVRDLSRDYPGVQLVANNDPVFTSVGRAAVLATIRVGNESGERRVSVNITGRIKMQ